MNHQEMCRLRQAKVDKIAEQYPPLKPLGEDKGELLVLSWGSTYGAVSRAVRELQQSGKKLSLIHLRHLNPLPLDLKDYLNQFDKILIPEINHGQLAQLIRGTYLKEVEQFNILQGRPFKVSELKEKMLEYI